MAPTPEQPGTKIDNLDITREEFDQLFKKYGSKIEVAGDSMMSPLKFGGNHAIDGMPLSYKAYTKGQSEVLNGKHYSITHQIDDFTDPEKFDYLIIEGGTNNQSEFSAKEAADYLVKLYEKGKTKSYKEVFITTIPPHTNKGSASRVLEINRHLRSYAIQGKIKLIDLEAGENGYKIEKHMRKSDNLHPNDKGLQLITERILLAVSNANEGIEADPQVASLKETTSKTLTDVPIGEEMNEELTSPTTAETQKSLTLSPNEFKKLSFDEKLQKISNISSTKELKEGTSLSFNFKGNGKLEYQIGLGDVMPSDVRKVKKGNIVYTRRANQGFYNDTNDYLAIWTGTTVEIEQIGKAYEADKELIAKFTTIETSKDGQSYKKLLDYPRSDKKVEGTEITYNELFTTAANFAVDPYLLESVISVLKKDPSKDISDPHEFMNMAARYIQNAEAKYEKDSKKAQEGGKYTGDFIMYALNRFNLFNDYSNIPFRTIEKIAKRYSKFRGKEIKIDKEKYEKNKKNIKNYPRKKRRIKFKLSDVLDEKDPRFNIVLDENKNVADQLVGISGDKLANARIIEREFKAAGLPNSIIAAAITNAKAESVLIANNANYEGEKSIGLFQCNMNGGLGSGHKKSDLEDPAYNSRVIIKEIMSPRGSALRTAAAQGKSIPALTAIFCRDIEKPDNIKTRMKNRALLATDLFENNIVSTTV